MQMKDVKRFLDKLDSIRVSQKIGYDTALCGSVKNRSMKGEISFSFSLLKGLIVLFAALAGAAALCCAWKRSVKKKLMKKLKKKYRLVKAGKEKD